MNKPSYIITGAKPWNRRLLEHELARLPGRWEFIRRQEECRAVRYDGRLAAEVTIVEAPKPSLGRGVRMPRRPGTSRLS